MCYGATCATVLRCYGVTCATVVRCYMCYGATVLHVLRCYGATVLRCYGATVLRCYGATVLRCYGATVLRCYGATVLRCCGATCATVLLVVPATIINLIGCYSCFADTQHSRMILTLPSRPFVLVLEPEIRQNVRVSADQTYRRSESWNQNMASRGLLLLLAVSASFCCFEAANKVTVSVVLSSDGKTLKVSDGKVFPNVAWAGFTEEISVSG